MGLSLLTQRRRQDLPVRWRRPLDRMELQSLGPKRLTWFKSTSSSSSFHGPFLKTSCDCDLLSSIIILLVSPFTEHWVSWNPSSNILLVNEIVFEDAGGLFLRIYASRRRRRFWIHFFNLILFETMWRLRRLFPTSLLKHFPLTPTFSSFFLFLSFLFISHFHYKLFIININIII